MNGGRTGREAMPDRPRVPDGARSLRDSFLQSNLGQPVSIKPDTWNEDLRAQINALSYELDTVKQDRDLALLEQEQAVRDAEARAEADFKRAQTAEAGAAAAATKHDSLVRELQQSLAAAETSRTTLERRVRLLTEENGQLKEQADEAEDAILARERDANRRVHETEARASAAQAAFVELEADLATKSTALVQANRNAIEQSATIEKLEKEVSELRVNGADAHELQVVRREFSDQVSLVRQLEIKCREQHAELRKLREKTTTVDLLAEEKRDLETKVRMMDELRLALAEARVQQEVLEDERRSWTSYLEAHRRPDGPDDGSNDDISFDSPEEMARAFMKLRIENASLLDRVGTLGPFLVTKEDEIRQLLETNEQLELDLSEKATELARLATEKAPECDDKVESDPIGRLERQYALAVQEITYLRAQLDVADRAAAEVLPGLRKAEPTKEVEEVVELDEADRLILAIEESEKQRLIDIANAEKQKLVDLEEAEKKRQFEIDHPVEPEAQTDGEKSPVTAAKDDDDGRSDLFPAHRDSESTPGSAVPFTIDQAGPDGETDNGSGTDDTATRIETAGTNIETETGSTTHGETSIHSASPTESTRTIEDTEEQKQAKQAEAVSILLETRATAQATALSELQQLVDLHRVEAESLQTKLTELESKSKSGESTTNPFAPLLSQSPLKRKRLSSGMDEYDRIVTLRQQNGELASRIAMLEQTNWQTSAELSATSTQLRALRDSTRVRVLELRDNPTSQAESIKTESLRLLRDENRQLVDRITKLTPIKTESTDTDQKGLPSSTSLDLADLDEDDSNDEARRAAAALVPLSTVTSLRNQLSELESEIASKEKRNKRRMQVFAAKAAEFREAVASILGWKMDFLPNGRVKVTSMFYPPDEDQERSIVFDGEAGTMKVSGGLRSEFAGEIRSLIEFWVEGKKEIPCFLAAMTLEFYERFSAA